MATLQDDDSLVTSQRAEFYSNSNGPSYVPNQTVLPNEQKKLPIEESQQNYFSRTFVPQNQYYPMPSNNIPQVNPVNNEVPPYLVQPTAYGIPQQNTPPTQQFNPSQFVVPTQYYGNPVVNDYDQSQRQIESKYSRLTIIFAVLGLLFPPLFILSFMFSRKTRRIGIRILGSISLLCFDILLFFFIFWFFMSY